MDRISEFWSWFKTFELRIRRAGQPIDDDILDLLLEKLHKVDDQLYFEIGTNPNTDVFELVVTPEGNKSKFEITEKIINSAPILDKWKFVAFKQAMGFDFTTEYEGIELNPLDMWFLPLESSKNPNAIGLRIGVNGYEHEMDGTYTNACYVVLDTCFGEKVVMENISYMDVCEIPDRPEDAGFIELIELIDYIEWKKSKII